jgi:hypothetical protein
VTSHGHRPGRGRVTLRAATLVAVGLLAPVASAAPALTVGELASEAALGLQELSRIRGLPQPAVQVQLVVRSREERRRFVAGEFRRKWTPGRLDAERRALAAWGLVPAGFDLETFLADLLVEQAAAYYDPVAKLMVLANWLGADEQKEALAHELVHVLQDREVDLDRFLTVAPGESDRALARQVLIEGEAVALSFDRTLRRRGADLAAIDIGPLRRAIAGSATGPMLARAPRFLRTLLTFPYADGLGFVHAFRRRYPWSDFSRLYRDPPTSTAQILHPERYLDRREDPVRVTLADLGPALGPGARRVIEDDMGEFGLTGVLREFLGDAETATGWRGDRYALWEDSRGADVLVAVAVFEAEPAAQAFADAYTRLLARKHALGIPSERSGGLTAWTAEPRALAVERRAAHVALVEGSSPAALAAVRAALWASLSP